jgi:hypothetical protein
MIQISFQLFVILVSTDVLREIRRDIAENLAKRRFPGAQKTNEASCPIGRGPPKDGNSEPRKSYPDSVLLFLAEFLESGIGAQGIPERVEPKKGRRNGRWVIKPAAI